MGTQIKLVSWNVRELNSKFKRALVLKYLRTHCPLIMFLQETHLLGNAILALKCPWIQRAIHATYSSYARGVTILLYKSLPCNIEVVVTDPDGRYAMVVFEIQACRIVFVNVYIPPPFTSGLLYEMLDKLATLTPVKILMAGDFNNILDYTLATSNPWRAHNLVH